jgi:hypothetical protein
MIRDAHFMRSSLELGPAYVRGLFYLNEDSENGSKPMR